MQTISDGRVTRRHHRCGKHAGTTATARPHDRTPHTQLHGAPRHGRGPTRSVPCCYSCTNRASLLDNLTDESPLAVSLASAKSYRCAAHCACTRHATARTAHTHRRPTSTNDDLRAELGEAFKDSGDPQLRPPSLWGLSQDGKTPRHSLHSNRSSMRTASSRAGTSASARTSAESQPWASESPPDVMTPTNTNANNSTNNANAGANDGEPVRSVATRSEHQRSASAGEAPPAEASEQTPVATAPKSGRPSFGLNQQRRRHSVEMASKNDIIEALKREKAEMLEEFTNLALAKAELEEPSAAEGVDADGTGGADGGDAGSIGPHGRNFSHTAESLEAMLLEQDRQLQAALGGRYTGEEGGKQAGAGDGGSRPHTSKVTVEVVKEVVQRRVNRNNGDARVMRDTRNARKEVYFTTKSVRVPNNGPWTDEETAVLKRSCRENTVSVLPMNVDFVAVAASLPGRTDRACQTHWKSLRRGRSKSTNSSRGGSAHGFSRSERSGSGHNSRHTPRKERSSSGIRQRGYERSPGSTASSWSGRSREAKSLSPSYKSRLLGDADDHDRGGGGGSGSRYNSQSSYSSGAGLQPDDADVEWFGARAHTQNAGGGGGGGGGGMVARRASTHDYSAMDSMAAAVASPRYTDRIMPTSGVVGV